MRLDEVLIFPDQAHCYIRELDAGGALGVGEPIVDACRTLLKSICIQTFFDLDFAVEDMRGILEQQDGPREEGAEAVDKYIRVVIGVEIFNLHYCPISRLGRCSARPDAGGLLKKCLNQIAGTSAS